MDSRASETLLQEFKRRTRRFRRRVRRRNRQPEPMQDADGGEPEQQAVGNPVNLAEELNQAVILDDDDSNDDAGVVVNDQDNSDTWSHDRIDQGREMIRLEQILLRENAEFHLHC